jgi:hypothetical protein
VSRVRPAVQVAAEEVVFGGVPAGASSPVRSGARSRLAGRPVTHGLTVVILGAVFCLAVVLLFHG